MKRTEQAVNAAKDYTLEQKQEYEKKLESQFADLSKRIDDLKQKAQSAQQGVTDKLQGTFDQLKKSQEVVEKKLPELRTSTSQAWGEVKDGVDKAMTDLSQAYEKARSHFK
jgi:archaellum component FlaC